MPTDPERFQQTRLPWSRWKHEILQNYLQVMAAVLRSWGVIYYVDGFAGPGRYIEDEIDGSPLLAAQHAHYLSSSNINYSLRCINVESVQTVFENLQESTRDFAEYVENLHGEFGALVPTVLRKVGNHPALFFLDPLGVKGLEWRNLIPILERQHTTELLIRFDANAALRHTGSDTSHHATFNAILGEDTSNYWKMYLVDNDHSSQARRECLSKAYEDKLRLHFDYVGRIPILSADDSFKYYLLFATRSLKGMQVMNDVFYNMQGLRDRTLDDEKLEHERLVQMDMFEPSPEEKCLNELEFLCEEVVEVLKSGNSFKRDELRGHVASQGDNFGRFSGPQFTAVLGGRPTGVSVPTDFENLRARIQIHNGLTPGNDKVEISLKH